MARAVINKGGVFLAKPGMQVEWGETALAFSPNGAQQRIFASGFAALGPYSDFYNRAVVPFGATFATPPLAYCMLNDNGPTRRAAMTMYLGTRNGQVVREPELYWETTTTELRIYSWFVGPSASYIICLNEAS